MVAAAIGIANIDGLGHETAGTRSGEFSEFRGNGPIGRVFVLLALDVQDEWNHCLTIDPAWRGLVYLVVQMDVAALQVRASPREHGMVHMRASQRLCGAWEPAVDDWTG